MKITTIPIQYSTPHPTWGWGIQEIISTEQLKYILTREHYTAAIYGEGVDPKGKKHKSYRSDKSTIGFHPIVIFDFDNGSIGYQEAIKKIQTKKPGLAFFAITTKSHQIAEKGFVDRFRLILPLSQSMQKDFYFQQYMHIAEDLGVADHIDVNPAKTLSTKFSPSPVDALFYYNKGNPLAIDVKLIVEQAKATQEAIKGDREREKKIAANNLKRRLRKDYREIQREEGKPSLARLKAHNSHRSL